MSTPYRIASLLASATEILYGLGLGDHVIGVSHECDFPAAARSKPRLTRSHVDATQTSLAIDKQVKEFSASGRSLYEIDEPLLVDLAPDLIVTQAQCDVCAIKYEDVISLVDRHASLRGTPVVALSPQRLEDVFDDITRLGLATSQRESAESYVRQLRQRVENVRQSTSNLTCRERPRVVCVEWVEPLMVAANWTPELVEFAGGDYGLGRTGVHSAYVSWEEIVAYDPEVLILIPCGFDLARTLTEVADMPSYDRWETLAAVRHGRVVAIDGNAYFNRSGPRLVETLEILAHLLHPSRFDRPPMISDPERAWSPFSP